MSWHTTILSSKMDELLAQMEEKPDKGLHIVINRSAFTNSCDYGTKIVICKNHVGGFLCNLENKFHMWPNVKIADTKPFRLVEKYTMYKMQKQPRLNHTCLPPPHPSSHVG